MSIFSSTKGMKKKRGAVKRVREEKQNCADMGHNLIFTVLRQMGKVMWRDGS